MANLARYVRELFDWDVVVIDNDFEEAQSDIRAVDTVTDSGTIAGGDAANGVYTFTPSDVSVADNDEAILATPNELFKFGTNRCIYGRFKFRYTAVVAADPNVAVGFVNAAATDPLGDNGAGVKTSGSCLAVAKVDGGTVFRCYSSCNGTSTVTASNKTIAAATDYVVEIEATDWDGVSMQVSFKVDGEYLRDTSNQIIKHTVAIASATEMNGFAAIKLGAATNNDTLLLDRWTFLQTRV